MFYQGHIQFWHLKCARSIVVALRLHRRTIARGEHFIATNLTKIETADVSCNLVFLLKKIRKFYWHVAYEFWPVQNM